MSPNYAFSCIIIRCLDNHQLVLPSIAQSNITCWKNVSRGKSEKNVVSQKQNARQCWVCFLLVYLSISIYRFRRWLDVARKIVLVMLPFCSTYMLLASCLLLSSILSFYFFSLFTLHEIKYTRLSIIVEKNKQTATVAKIKYDQSPN